MKKILLTSLLFLSACSFLSAQEIYPDKEFDVKIGTPFLLPRGINRGFIGNVEKGFVQVSDRPNEALIFQLFDKNLKMSKETKIPVDKGKPVDNHELVIEIGGKCFYVYTFLNKADNKQVLYAQEYDIMAGKANGQPKLLLSLTEPFGLNNSETPTDAYREYFNFYQSQDKSKLLIAYSLLKANYNWKTDKDKIGFMVIDASLDVITDKIVDMPYPKLKMKNEQFGVDANGNAYIISKVYEEMKWADKPNEEVHNLPNFHFEIIRINAKTNEAKTTVMKNESYFMKQFYMCDLPSGDMVFGSFYSKEKEKNEESYFNEYVDGTFLSKIDASGAYSIIDKGFYEFSDDALMLFMDEKDKQKFQKRVEKKDEEVKHMILRKIITTSDDGFELIGEITIGTTTRRDLLVMKVSGNGNVEWVRGVIKRQEETMPGWTSMLGTWKHGFASYHKDGNTYFFYPENIKNRDLKAGEELKDRKDEQGVYLVYTKIDAKGEITKGELFNITDPKISYESSITTELNDGLVINRLFNKDKHMARLVVISHK